MPHNAYVKSVLARWKNETADTKEIVERICRLAKNKDLKGLANVVGWGVSVNTYCSIYNAVSLLALQNEVAAVKLLIKYFDGDIKSAIFGGSIAGNEAFVESLTEEYSEAAVYGYLLGGHDKQAIKMYSKVYDAYGSLEAIRIKVLAQLGRHEEVMTSLNRTNEGLYREAVIGYAIAGDIQNLIKLQNFPERAILFSFLLPCMLIQAGSFGNVTLIKYLHSSMTSLLMEDRSTHDRLLLRSLAKAGYHTKMYELLSHFVKEYPEEYAFGCIEGSHIQAFNRTLREKESIFFRPAVTLFDLSWRTPQTRFWAATFCERDYARAMMIPDARKSAAKIRAAMDRYQINFYEAQKLRMRGVFRWLTQIVPKLALFIPLEILEEITKNLLGDFPFYQMSDLVSTYQRALANHYERTTLKKHSLFAQVEEINEPENASVVPKP